MFQLRGLSLVQDRGLVIRQFQPSGDMYASHYSTLAMQASKIAISIIESVFPPISLASVGDFLY